MLIHFLRTGRPRRQLSTQTGNRKTSTLNTKSEANYRHLSSLINPYTNKDLDIAKLSPSASSPHAKTNLG